MNHEHEQSLAPSVPADVERCHDTIEPGKSSRSALLRKPDHAITSGLVQRKLRDAHEVAGGAENAVVAGEPSSGSRSPDTLIHTLQRKSSGLDAGTGDAGVDGTRFEPPPLITEIDEFGIEYTFRDNAEGRSEFHKAADAIKKGAEDSPEFSKLLQDLKKAHMVTQISLNSLAMFLTGEANAKVDVLKDGRQGYLISIAPSGSIRSTYLLLPSRDGGYLNLPDGGLTEIAMPINFEITLFHEFGHIRGALRSKVPITKNVGPEHPINTDPVRFQKEGYRVFDMKLTPDQSEKVSKGLQRGLHPPSR